VGTRKSKVWVVTDRARGGVGDEVKEFAPTLPKKIPNGGCFSKDGFLYIPEQNRVLEYPAAEFFYESADVVAGVVVPEGELIPKSEESYNHTARTCRVGPDNKLYIQLGQPYNVPAKEKFDLYRKVGMGGIIRMDRDGKRSMRLDSATRSAWTFIPRTSRSGPTTIRSMAWATSNPRAK
jgi:glucose/arabinose dehydrogenase